MRKPCSLTIVDKRLFLFNDNEERVQQQYGKLPWERIAE
jgi:hypothetical protein